MFRVAGVAALICDNLTGHIDKDNVLLACLLHDTGNIIRFNLRILPDLLEPEGAAYWGKVQQEFKAKYGQDENQATYSIAREIGVNERVYELILSVGFRKSPENHETTDLAKKIMCYADQRVAPSGVTSLEKRLEEGRRRYLQSGRKEEVDFESYASYLKKMEEQIFATCKIKPSEINESTVSTEIEKLRKFEIA